MTRRHWRGWHILVALLAVALFGACGRSGDRLIVAPKPGAATTTTTTPAGSTKVTLSYCPNTSPAQQLDLYIPNPAPATPQPLLVFVHGGGWHKGSKTLGRDGFSNETATRLLQQNWLVASIDYRLADLNADPPTDPFPAQIIDVKCAVRFLRSLADAATYPIDAGHIYAMGSSAGGHLVSLLGVTDPSAGWDCAAPSLPGQELCAESSRVQGVVALWPVEDFTTPGWNGSADEIIQEVFGQAPGVDSPLLEQASPVSYLSLDDPDFLLVQGDQDALNLPDQVAEVGPRFPLAGISTTLVLVHRGPHGALQPNEEPGPGQLVSRIVTFLTTQASG